MNPDRFRLTVAVIQKSAGSSTKKGLCTGNMETFYNTYFGDKPQPGTCYLRGFTKGSLFTLPSSVSVPMIMIGPGCGIAPFIGYIEEREYEMDKNKGATFGPMELYYGCRRREKDFIYGKELQQWKEKEVLTGLFLAFSRDQVKKVYVQDLVRNNKEKLYKYIKEQGAVVHICGSLAMGEGIKQALLDVLRVGEKKPEVYLETLEKTGRVIAELWG